ncbi:MAG: hypothetical protein MK084_08085 [Prochlorococcus sp. ALOHA_A2.0_50]|nr:hypothetical protein [Prochlorococcus sp. ALOHA_A2.0_50]
MAGKNQRKYSFQEVVEKKVDNVSKSIEVLTKLSNRKNYDYDQSQVNKIFKYLRGQLDIAEKNFNKPSFKIDFKL